MLLEACLVVAARLVGSVTNIVHDCDEVYNYWEPLHYLTHGYGKQTWEYRCDHVQVEEITDLWQGSARCPLPCQLPCALAHGKELVLALPARDLFTMMFGTLPAVRMPARSQAHVAGSAH